MATLTKAATCVVNYNSRTVSFIILGVPKRRTPWFILTITSVNMERF